MTKRSFNLRKVATIVACLVVTTMFAACDKTNPDEDDNGNGNNSTTSETGVVINGVKWATRNVDKPGTFAAKPESAGMFYQWNRKIAYPTTGNITNWDNTVPEGDEWSTTNDPSPSGWRLPTLGDFIKLAEEDKVKYEWTTQNGVGGGKFTDKTTGKSIFLPAVGRRFDNELLFAGEYGYYWTSMTGGVWQGNAFRMMFGLSNGVTYLPYSDLVSRSHGNSIRPVAK